MLSALQSSTLDSRLKARLDWLHTTSIVTGLVNCVQVLGVKPDASQVLSLIHI